MVLESNISIGPEETPCDLVVRSPIICLTGGSKSSGTYTSPNAI